jgi:hypothetical protein
MEDLVRPRAAKEGAGQLAGIATVMLRKSNFFEASTILVRARSVDNGHIKDSSS